MAKKCARCAGDLNDHKTRFSAVPGYKDGDEICPPCHEFLFPSGDCRPNMARVEQIREMPDETAPLADMKEALGAVSKPDVTHIRRELKVYGARACEYGSEKYQRANYIRNVETPAKDFERLRTYLRACMDHCDKTLGAMEEHQSRDPELTDTKGMAAAAAAPDMEAGQNFPASGLPHLCHAVASLNMAIKQAVDCGLLPADPGTPWRESK